MAASAMGCSASFLSGDGVTRTKNAGIPCFLKSGGKSRRILYYRLGRIGNGWPSHDAFLEVDDNQRRL
jgi:hypothetical protein